MCSFVAAPPAATAACGHWGRGLHVLRTHLSHGLNVGAGWAQVVSIYTYVAAYTWALRSLHTVFSTHESVLFLSCFLLALLFGSILSCLRLHSGGTLSCLRPLFGGTLSCMRLLSGGTVPPVCHHTRGSGSVRHHHVLQVPCFTRLVVVFSPFCCASPHLTHTRNLVVSYDR